MKIAKRGILAGLILLLTSCATPQPHKSALELQAIQSKQFETSKKVAFAATLSVFQDLGYIISAANLDTGLITAKSPTKQNFVLFVGQRMSDTKATAFVEQITPKDARVRLNFVRDESTSSGYGMKGENDTPIEDARPYQEAFAKIEHAIFIRKNVN